MEDVFLPIMIVGILFIGLPWIIFHYVSKWKTAATLTTEDENLLDELHDLARRLDDRMCTIERIIQAENPNWRTVACDPVEQVLEDRVSDFGSRSLGRRHDLDFDRDLERDLDREPAPTTRSNQARRRKS